MYMCVYKYMELYLNTELHNINYAMLIWNCKFRTRYGYKLWILKKKPELWVTIFFFFILWQKKKKKMQDEKNLNYKVRIVRKIQNYEYHWDAVSFYDILNILFFINFLLSF